MPKIVQAGEFPQRPSDGIPDQIWMFLETCWSRDPSNRPSTVQVYNTLSRFQPNPPPNEEPPNADKSRTVSIPDVRSEGSISVLAQSYIDEISEVTQLVFSPPCTHFTTTLLGTRMCESKAGGEKCHRTSDVVRYLPYGSNIISARGRREGRGPLPAHLPGDRNLEG